MAPGAILVYALALSLAAPQAAASSSTAAGVSPAVVSTWLGVSLGESPKDVRAQLGKPREIVPSSVGDLWRYDVDNGNVTLELVIQKDQVLNIAARIKDGKQSNLADPLGGALGMTTQALQTARGTPIASYDNGANLAYGQPSGVRWFYSLDNGAVTAIAVSMPLPSTAPAEVIADASHDGSRLERAFMVQASHESDATNAEMAFIAKLTCDGGIWQVVGQEPVPAAGRHFDLFHVTCSTTKAARDVYFDITSSFGK